MIVPTQDDERRAERWSDEMNKAWTAFECMWVALLVVGGIEFLVGRAIYLAMN